MEGAVKAKANEIFQHLHRRTNKNCKNLTQDSLKMKQKCQLLNHKYPENESEVWTGGPQGFLYSQVISGRTFKAEDTISVNFST